MLIFINLFDLCLHISNYCHTFASKQEHKMSNNFKTNNMKQFNIPMVNEDGPCNKNMGRGGKREGAGRPRKNDQTFVYARMPQNVKEWYKRMAHEHNCTVGEWLNILRQNYIELNKKGIY